MTSTEIAPTDESTETTEPQAPSQDESTEAPVEKKAIRLAPLPDSVLNPTPTKVKTIALGAIFAAKADETNALLDDFANIREAQAKAESALEKSDHPLAIEYRKVSTAVDQTVKALENDSDEAKEIQKLKEIIAAKVKEARELQRTKRSEAQAAVTGDVVSEFNPDELTQKLTDLNTVLVTMKKVLADENPDLSKWNVIDPGRAMGKKGSRKGKTGTKRPRLAYAFIDDVEVVKSGKFVTTTDVAKKLGIADVGNLNTLMFQAVGNPDQIPATEFHFPVTVQNVEHQIRVAGRTSSDAEESADDSAA